MCGVRAQGREATLWDTDAHAGRGVLQTLWQSIHPCAVTEHQESNSMKQDQGKTETPAPVGSTPLVRRLRVDELTRLAFVWAEQDRAGLADAWPRGSSERAECLDMVRQLRAYRMKRWGRTKLEAVLGSAKAVAVGDMKTPPNRKRNVENAGAR